MTRGRFAGIVSALLALALMVAAMPAAGEGAPTAGTGGPATEAALAPAPALAAGSLVQEEEPPLTVTTLVSAEIGLLPNEPLRWLVREFRWAPGVRTSPGPHPPVAFYVLEGVSTLTQEGVTVSFAPGSGGFDKGVDHVHDNLGNVPARVLAFIPNLLRRTPLDLPTTMTLFESEPLEGLKDGPYTLVLHLLEARPGPVPTHIHPGPTLGYLLEGTIEHTLGGVTTTRRPGDAWVEQPGVISSGQFGGRMKIRLLVAQLLPQGEPWLIPVE